MKVKVTRVKGAYGDEEYSVETPRNRIGMYDMTDYPEDATLSRDLNDIYKLPNMLREVWEAGKNGDELVFEEIIDKVPIDY